MTAMSAALETTLINYLLAQEKGIFVKDICGVLAYFISQTAINLGNIHPDKDEHASCQIMHWFLDELQVYHNFSHVDLDKACLN